MKSKKPNQHEQALTNLREGKVLHAQLQLPVPIASDRNVNKCVTESKSKKRKTYQEAITRRTELRSDFEEFFDSIRTKDCSRSSYTSYSSSSSLGRDRLAEYNGTPYPTVDFLELFDFIQKHIANPEDVTAIVLFGSSVTCHLDVVYKNTGLFRKRKKIADSKLRYIKKCRDIDVLVLLRRGAKKKCTKMEMDSDAIQQSNGGYGSMKKVTMIVGLVEVFCLTQDEYEESVRSEHCVSEHISQYGVLVAGSFPYVLKNKSRIEWGRKGRLDFHPEQRGVRRIKNNC